PALSSRVIGGTNGFVVIEQAPAVDAEPITPLPHLLTLSARTEAALAATVERFLDHLSAAPDSALGDVAYTSNVSRSQHSHRVAVTGGSVMEVREKLAAAERRGPRPGAEGGPRVAFLFTGQGSHYPGIATEHRR